MADFETVVDLSKFEPLIFEQGDGVSFFVGIAHGLKG
jgi:hypothetical protein